MGLCLLGTQKRVRNSRGKRAISVRASEVLLYSFFFSIDPGEIACPTPWTCLTEKSFWSSCQHTQVKI